MKITIQFLIVALFLSTNSFAQDSTAKGHKITIRVKQNVPFNKPYWGNSFDGMIFSTALINNNGIKSLGTLRFSSWFHVGATYNYNINKNVGIYTGIDVKNIGFIEKYSFKNSTTKQRVYTVGVPIGLRFGNMKDRSYFFLGGGLDVAFHYKSKYWDATTEKKKFNEWFSDKTNILMPNLFAGIAFKSTTIKIQYYPTNFYNEDYSVGGVKPNANNKVNLLLFSVGRDMNFSKKN